MTHVAMTSLALVVVWWILGTSGQKRRRFLGSLRHTFAAQEGPIYPPHTAAPGDAACLKATMVPSCQRPDNFCPSLHDYSPFQAGGQCDRGGGVSSPRSSGIHQRCLVMIRGAAGAATRMVGTWRDGGDAIETGDSSPSESKKKFLHLGNRGVLRV
ncbi:hypothetical protein EDC04DRAFT_2625720 [Pisolithus marmoratus]|nr:hypothetical protein EDC04DRAFT_2625720 [Pisolithus marmoratus]